MRSQDPNARGLTACLVTDSREPSGVGEHMLALAAKLRPHVRVLFACPPSPTGQLCLDRAVGLGLETLAFGWERPHAGDRFAAWLDARGVDVCHVHAGIAWEGFDVVSAARQSGVPVVIRTEHLPFVIKDRLRRAWYAGALQCVDKLICVSEGARDCFVEADIPADLITVIRNGILVPSVRGDRSRIRAALGLDAHDRVVLTVARYTYQKGHDTLLDAIPSVLAGAPCARFVWVGTGPLEAVMREAVCARGLDRHVAFLGQRHDVPDLMRGADLFVLPSRFEGLPLAVLEAMAAKLPVVATRVCGTEEAVQDGVTGVLVEPDDPQALAAALSNVLTKPHLARRLGASGYARVKRAFEASRMAQATLALYRELLDRSVQFRGAHQPAAIIRHQPADPCHPLTLNRTGRGWR
jgi:glycosyltransferase involved in cell wall biosynthesis